MDWLGSDHVETPTARMQQWNICVFCAWSMLRGYKRQRSSVGDSIRSVMTYANPAWEFAADTHLMKLQRLQNKIPFVNSATYLGVV
jgi:hypothetical protein